MRVNPFQEFQPDNSKTSPIKPINEDVFPSLTLTQVNSHLTTPDSLLKSRKVIILARVLDIRSMNTRAQITITDNTDNTTMIITREHDHQSIDINKYYQFIVSFREDNDEKYLLCQYQKQVVLAEQIMHFHMKVMKEEVRRKKMLEKQ